MPESPVIIPALIVSLVFVFVHLSSHRIYGFSKRYKKRILSFSGGVASAYVFLDLLPLIENADPHLRAILGSSPLINNIFGKSNFWSGIYWIFSILCTGISCIKIKGLPSPANNNILRRNKCFKKFIFSSYRF